MDWGMCDDKTLGTGTAWRLASRRTTQACCVALAHVVGTLGTERAAVSVHGHAAQNLEWLERFSRDRGCKLCQAAVGSLWYRC